MKKSYLLLILLVVLLGLTAFSSRKVEGSVKNVETETEPVGLVMEETFISSTHYMALFNIANWDMQTECKTYTEFVVLSETEGVVKSECKIYDKYPNVKVVISITENRFDGTLQFDVWGDIRNNEDKEFVARTVTDTINIFPGDYAKDLGNTVVEVVMGVSGVFDGFSFYAPMDTNWVPTMVTRYQSLTI